MTTKPLQRRTPGPFKRHIAARTITAIGEKIFLLRSIVMTLALLLFDLPAVVPPSVGGNVRFVAGVSHALSRTDGNAAGFSIATTAELVSDTPHCNNALSDAPAENFFRIPSTNTSGSAAVVPLRFFFSLCGSLDLFERLMDLGWGSWEVCSQKAQVSEGNLTPLRGAFSFRRFTIPRTLSKLLQSC
jgi:hypothetical protein